MPDRPSGPRRYVPVPGIVDLDAVEDANFAEALGEDSDTEPPRPSAPRFDAVDAFGGPMDDEPDPLSPPAPPPLDAPDEAPDPSEGALDAPEEAPDLTESSPDTTEHGPDLTELTADLAAASPEPVRQDPDRPDVAPDTSPEAPRAPEPAPPAEPGEPPTTTPDDAPAVPTPPAEPGDPAAEADGALPAPRTPSTEVVATAREATRSRGRELVQLVVRYGRAHVPATPAREAVPDAGPPKMVGRVGQLIPFLQVVPWVLAALFALSFWWDFDGQAVVVLGETLPLDGLLRVLTVSGLIGFGTNWLAITMLFQPREKRAIIPQGLIPAQRERVIYRLSEAISRELINADIIKQKIQESGVIGRYRDLALGVVRGVVEDPGFRTDLKDLAQGYAHEVLGSESVRREVARLAVEKVEQQAGGGLGGVALRLYRTFAEDDFQRRVDRALDELPDAVIPLLDRIDVALDAVPGKVEARADEIEEAATAAVLSFVEGFDVRTMISERAREFDEGQLEGLLKSTSNEQLNYIKYLGAILGVFGGFVIWQPLGALAVFVTAGLLLWAADEALVRARR